MCWCLGFGSETKFLKQLHMTHNSGGDTKNDDSPNSNVGGDTRTDGTTEERKDKERGVALYLT